MMRLLQQLFDSRWFRERILGEEFISLKRAHEVFCRQEMGRHPWERVEPWCGMESEHLPLGRRVLRFDLSKRRIFKPTRQAS